jgi:hypothetical protein
MCSEAEARQILEGERATALVEIIEGGWNEYVAEKRVRRPRARANIVWDNMIDLADDKLTPLTGVKVTRDHDNPMWVIDDRLLLRFKKLDREFMTRNVLTKIQRAFNAQQGFVSDLVLLSCGYRLDLANAGIDAISIVKRVNRKVEWTIDLRELAAGVLTPATPILGADEYATDLPKITPAPIEVKDQD